MAYNKFYAKKVMVRGMKFDSVKEARRYNELLLLQRAGELRDLKRQVPFELLPTQREESNGKKCRVVEHPVKYIADFTYTDKHGRFIVEDVKGIRTKEYIIKRKLMLYFFKIKIREV